MHNNAISVAHTTSNSRNTFIRKTYLHLLMAVLAFVGVEVFLFKSGLAMQIMQIVSGTSWFFALGAFMIVSWLATRFAQGSQSKTSQYGGLALYIVAEAIIFVPLLIVAQFKTGGQAIESAGLATVAGFLGLTFIAFGTKADFSWMGKFLMWAGLGAILLIICGMIFGFNLGVYFSVGMIFFAGAAILYDTSNIIHHYQEEDYVAASLQLFASVALMFWYLLSFFNSRD